MLETLKCRVFGHTEFEKIALGVGIKRYYYRCKRCGKIEREPTNPTNDRR